MTRTTLYRHGDKAPEGYHWVAMPEPTSGYNAWRLSDEGRRCRWGSSPGKPACRQPAVAKLNRRTWRGDDRWWHYCEDHMYGRWVEDGQIWCWVLREIGDEI